MRLPSFLKLKVALCVGSPLSVSSKSSPHSVMQHQLAQLSALTNATTSWIFEFTISEVPTGITHTLGIGGPLLVNGDKKEMGKQKLLHQFFGSLHSLLMLVRKLQLALYNRNIGASRSSTMIPVSLELDKPLSY